MKTITSQNNGLSERSNGYSVEELLSALTEEQYRHLVGFARLRLRAVTQTRWLQRCLSIADAEDLVNQAILKLHLGEYDPSIGRHLKSRNRVDMVSFLACVRGVISSDLYNLVNEAKNRHEHLFVGDPETEPNAIDPVELEDLRELLSRRDLHRVFFRKLYQRIENQPSLLAIVQDWEARALDDDRIGQSGMSRIHRDLVCRVRQLARNVIAELAENISPSLSQDEGMAI